MTQRFHLLALSVLLALPTIALAGDPPAAASTATDQAPMAPAAAPASAASDAPAPAAAPALPATPATAVSSASPSADAPIAGGKVPPPPAGKGQVVFFRNGGMGMLISFMVREGTTELGKLSNSSYFVATLDPGPHDFVVHTESKDTLHVEVEAGETTFVRGSISMGLFVGHPNIAPSDQSTFEQHFNDLKLNK